MARAARFALADARAMEEQGMRRQLHGGAFYGAGMTLGDQSSDSESDSESDMEGGGILSALGKLGSSAAAGLGRFGSSAASAARATAARLSATRAAAASAAARSAAVRPVIADRTSQALVPLGTAGRPIATPSMPASFYAQFGRAAPAAAKGTLATRLAGLGVTPARVAAALAAGVGIAGLEAYFQSQGTQLPGENFDFGFPGGPGGPGPIIDTTTPPPEIAVDPLGPVGPGTGPGTGPGGRPGRTPRRSAMTDINAALRSGNVAERYLTGTSAQKTALAQQEGLAGAGMCVGGAKARKGKAKGTDGRSIRAQKVKAIMAMHKLSLPAASKYLKEHPY